MTPAQRALYLHYAWEWSRVAVEATAALRTMRDAGMPVERCIEAQNIASLAFELAGKLEELARAAAPMPPREGSS